MTEIGSPEWLAANGRECPSGHGPMIFYASSPEDDVDDFFECPDCGHREIIPGQRSAEPYDEED